MLEALRSLIPDRLRGDRPVVPLVRVAGVIGSSVRLRPGVTIDMIGGALTRAFAYKAAPAVAIVVNSPGGLPVQSHLIHRRIRDLATEKEKQVLVFVEDVAASGGYMIALAGDEIFVDPSSIVGSIGVVSAGFGFQDLIKRIGVERRVHAAGERKAMLDAFEPERPEDVAHLEAMQREVHTLFIELVRSRRGAKLAPDPALFSGAFWTGGRGIELGLADAVGNVHAVLRQRFGKDVRVKVVSSERGFLRRRLGLAAPGLAAGPIDAIMAAVEERSWWSRYGL